MAREMHFPENWKDFGPKVRALRTDRERRFVWAYLLGSLYGKPNAAQAARDAGYSDIAEGAKVRASELMQRDSVLDAMHEVAARELRGLAIPAVAAASVLLRSRKHPDHAKMVNSVLSRVGFDEKSSIDVNVQHSVVDQVGEALDHLRMLKQLEVPRAKLVEVFGHSGLERYEAMLAEQDGRALPAPVDAEFREVEG